jgi:amino acid adenylation domain-containing protein
MSDSSHYNNISPSRQLLLDLIIEERKKQRRDLQNAAKKSGEDNIFPLSFAQQRLWFINQLEPNNTSYILNFPIYLNGSLHVAVLERSLQEIVRRHESLRTVFVSNNGHPMQTVIPTLTIPLATVDLREIREIEREDCIRQMAVAEVRRPFDLACGPLIRITLLYPAEQEHILLLTMHHIVSDAWSMGVFVRELTALYKAFAQGYPSPLPELSIQYKDYVAWQQQWLQGTEQEQQLSYWRAQLANLPLLQLPTTYPRPTTLTFQGRTHDFALSSDITEQLVGISRQGNATLFMTLLAASLILLQRYSRQNDIAVGTPIANRTWRATEPLIGFFVNTLVMRGDLSGNPTFQELLSRVRTICLEAYAHQDLPFEQLVEDLQPARDLSRQPLFQVLFAFQSTKNDILELPGLTMRWLEVEHETAKFDLSFLFRETDDGLYGSLEYSTDLFDNTTIVQMARHLQNLLASIATGPEQRISDLALLTVEEQHQLLVSWNNTRTGDVRDRCVHQLIEKQVSQTPEAIAVSFEYEQVTYWKINERANQLAHYLQSAGVKSEIRVGICMERSIDLVIGLLGIWKAGGAYVPLDPTYPPDRLSFMLQDAQAQILVTQERLLNRLPQNNIHTICLDRDRATISSQPGSSPVNTVLVNNLAYVIYTSGSSGRPKGVAIEHRSTLTLLDWARSLFAEDDFAGILASTSICFDLSVFELFAPLICGGTIIMTEHILQLPTLPQAKKVTMINTVPSAVSELLRVDGIPPSVRTVNLAGEALQNRLVQQLYQRDTITRVFNLYGPTEDTTYSTCALMEQGSNKIPPIGRPITDRQIYLLDTNLRLAPIGVPGELYIGGNGLARGYLNRPDLTGERFIPNPFSGERGARLYKTGDLARYNSDGVLDFLGRIDHQIKVRGFRIELSEIEAMLRQHPAVQEAVVLAIEDSLNNKRLVAYIVPQPQQNPAFADMLRFLRKQLPNYMIPATFCLIQTLLLMPNGKVDRHALSTTSENHSRLATIFAEPRTLIEEILAGIWVELLHIDRAGIHDNFFDLGGHSLLAMQMVARVRDSFNVELPLRRVFERSTLVELAESIEEMRRKESIPPAPPIEPITREDTIPLSFAQQSLWFLTQLVPDNPAYNIAIAARLVGLLNITALEQSVGAIIQRHEILRTTFPIVDGRPVQMIAARLFIPLKVVDLQTLPPDKQEPVILQQLAAEAERPFDLVLGPLVRVTLLRLSEAEHIVLLNMHHIISDGWSLGILIQEVATCYAAYSRGEEPDLPNLPVQYADYSVWQREAFQPHALEHHKSYWQMRLAHLPELYLPTDRPRPPISTFHGLSHNFMLDKMLGERLGSLSRSTGTTLFMSLLAAFQILLHCYSGQDDIVVGTDVANRNRIEVEHLVGFFVNQLPLRINLSGHPTFKEILKRVRTITMEAYEHQDFPFEKLVSELQPVRSLNRAPLFQVKIVFQNIPMQTIELPDLTFQPLAIVNKTAQFDLLLSLQETANGLSGTFHYSSDIYDTPTIIRMQKQFEVLLETVTAHPDLKLDELVRVVDSQHKQQKIVEETSFREFRHQKLRAVRRRADRGPSTEEDR